MMLLRCSRPAARQATRRLKSIAASPQTAPDIVIVSPIKTAAPASTILIDLPDRAAPTPSQLISIAGELGKSRLSGFVAMTGAMGYAATGAPLLAPGFALTTLGVFGTSCAANALNQIRETERDARMARTRKRPLPSGRCTPEFAATFAGVAGGAGALVRRRLQEHARRADATCSMSFARQVAGGREGCLRGALERTTSS